jgi:RNA polymerase sigma-70 factor (ECF subfamily)
MIEDNDRELVLRCRRGDLRAFEVLVSRYERPVYNAALRMLRHPDDARDVMQTVFLKAFEHLAEYDPGYRFYSWIYRIAINESINQLNARKRFGPMPEDAIADEPGPHDCVDSEQAGRHVQAALMRLKGDDRAVIVLRHFLDCSYEDMATILSVPEKTVKSRLFSARQRLKDTLRSEGLTDHD